MQNADKKPVPFVKTTVARLMLPRMRVTHEERGITVISGDPGIGKTSAIDAFEQEFNDQCLVVKIESPATSRGIKNLRMLQLVIEALKTKRSRYVGEYLGNTPWVLKQKIESLLSEWSIDFGPDAPWPPTFTIIFDEAQNLSKEAIELLRYWNDQDRCSMPFPVGLIFVGNDEFAMQRNERGESVLSSAVRSRLLYEVPLSYQHLDDADMTLLLESRGVKDPNALRELVAHLSHERVKRNLRQMNKVLMLCHREADGGPITEQVVKQVLQII